MRLPHHIAARKAGLERRIKKFRDLIDASLEPRTSQEKRVLTIRKRVLKQSQKDLDKLNSYCNP